MPIQGPPGIAPPPMAGPRAPMMGPGQKYQPIINVCRELLKFITDNPETARDLHPFVDGLTDFVQRSVAPTKRPGAGSPPAGPTLDQTPTGADEGPGSSMGALLMRQYAGPGGM